ncbi:MAG: L,D-transpeptidase [Myxococcales bacterium]|nr:L,D-transpeptidase [Polyangiaceae bacterium]MDW8250981.1 L,D-transpeptidase [Myxococcales bacterium]
MGWRTYIFAGKNRKVELGVIRPGTSVALRSLEPEPGEDCKSGRWYAVEPTGYVCEDRNTTTDLESELYRALATLAPDFERTLPFGYGYSTGAPMYGKIPSAEEARKAERKFRPPEKLKLPRKPSGHLELAREGVPASTGAIPWFFAGHREAPRMPWQEGGLVRKTIREGNLLSFQGVVEDEGGRRYLLATNLTAVPADRVWVFQPSIFQGVEINEKNPLPLAWTRRDARPRWVKEAGRFVEHGSIPPRTAVGLSGKQEAVGGEVYLELRDGGGWIKASHVSVVEAPEALPTGVEEGERWIDISLSAGTLALLEGRRMVFSTLMSPGAGGTTQSPRMTIEDLLAGAFTPLGLYRVSYKYLSAVMTPEEGPEPETTWIDDVPYTIYFRPPYAIHTAYWHEDFGHPKSGGCVNVSPLDARRIFHWTYPQVPEGWYGASNRLPGPPGTWIHLRK